MAYPGMQVAAEYRDAVLSLLMGYAAHRDLPPNEAEHLHCLHRRGVHATESSCVFSSRCWHACLRLGPLRHYQLPRCSRVLRLCVVVACHAFLAGHLGLPQQMRSTLLAQAAC